MTETPRADALLAFLLSGEESVERFATLTDEHERKKALYVLLAMLTDPSDALCIQAVRALGALGDRRAVEPLLNSLDDRDEELFAAKVSALAALRDPEAIEPLVTHDMNRNHWIVNIRMHEFDREDMLQALHATARHPDDLVRYSVLNALRNLADRRSIAVFLEVLADPSPRFRKESVEALVKMRVLEAVPILMQQTGEPDASVRRLAVKALGSLRDPQAIPTLLPLLDDDNELVRLITAFALGKMGDATGADAIRMALGTDHRASQYEIDEALDAFKTLRLPAVPLLVPLADKVLAQISDGHSTLLLIIEIFADQSDPAALPVLKRMLMIERDDAGLELLAEIYREKNETVRQAAQQAIDHITGNRAGRNDE